MTEATVQAEFLTEGKSDSLYYIYDFLTLAIQSCSSAARIIYHCMRWKDDYKWTAVESLEGGSYWLVEDTLPTYAWM
jgi:hypothetical protein